MCSSPLVAALAGLALASCSASPFSSGACTEIGCIDQFHATVTSASGAVPNGTHVLTVTADGATASCTFSVPGQTSAGGGTFQPQCPPPILAAITRAQSCTTTQTSTTSSVQCTPIPDHFAEEISISGAPVTLHVSLTVNGAVVLDRTTTPSYVATRPNGPGCEPLCHQASASWTFTSTAP
jgi:hypothetical protein